MSTEINISDVMKNVLVMNIDMTLDTVIKQANWNYYSCVVVVDDENNMFGIITRQLIGYASKRKLNFHTLKAWEICTPETISVPPDLPLKEAIEIMKDNNVRHLIIKDSSGYVGVITPLDILSLIDLDNPDKPAVDPQEYWHI